MYARISEKANSSFSRFVSLIKMSYASLLYNDRLFQNYRFRDTVADIVYHCSTLQPVKYMKVVNNRYHAVTVKLNRHIEAYFFFFSRFKNIYSSRSLLTNM